jgi:hypothetical protein
MKYILLINHGTSALPGSDAWEDLPEDEKGRVYADFQAINEHPDTATGPRMDMPDTATTVRVQDGKTLTTDGPYVETKEALGGFFFFEAEDLDAAIDMAASVPQARLGGAVEIRPLVEQ